MLYATTFLKFPMPANKLFITFLIPDQRCLGPRFGPQISNVQISFGKLTHTCFEEQYYRKAGACLGLSTLIKDLNLSIDWIKDSQLELVRKFIRTMLFVLKDIPSDVPSHVRKEAKDLLLYVLEQCNKEITEEQQKKMDTFN